MHTAGGEITGMRTYQVRFVATRVLPRPVVPRGILCAAT